MRGVIMLVNTFPPVPAGGAERQAERLAEYMASVGLSVGVITRAAPALPRHEVRDGYWIERIPEPGIGKIKTVTFMLGVLLSLFRRRKQYDILHAHLAFAPALVGAMLARLLGKRAIVKFGTSGTHGEIAISQRKLRGRVRLALLRRWTDMSIVLDKGMEQELIAAGFPAERVLRMDNGIDEKPFSDLPRVVAKQDLKVEGRTVILYTGRLIALKMLPTLLQALYQAVQSCPQLYLLIVGQGPERTALEQQVRQLGLSNHVNFVGNVQNVRPYLAAADIFVLPSSTEGISNALLEAMAAGLACIASAVGGLPEMLDDGACGILVEPGNVEQLSETLIRLTQDPLEIKRLGNAAHERILTRYSFSVVGDEYQKLYARLLQNTPSRTLGSKTSKEIG